MQPVSEALAQYLRAAGTAVGTRFYLVRLPQNTRGALADGLSFPAAYFSVDLDPVHTHDERTAVGNASLANIEITIVGRSSETESGARQALLAAREVIDAMAAFDGYRRGRGDDGDEWAVTIGGTLLNRQDDPDWHEIQRTWEVDLVFFATVT